MKKYLTALILALCLVLALLPSAALAEDADPLMLSIGDTTVGSYSDFWNLSIALMGEWDSCSATGFTSNIVIEVSGNVSGDNSFYVPAMANGYTCTIKSVGDTAYTVSKPKFYVNYGGNLILENITLDAEGGFGMSYAAMVYVNSDSSSLFPTTSTELCDGTLTIGDGATLTNGGNDWIFSHGAVDVSSSAGATPKLIMQSGSMISNCGRGVWLDASWGGNVEFEMIGGTISDNGAGGGVLVGSNTKFTMTGGSIKNNTGSEYGNGGISVNGGTVVIGGSANVTGNGVGGNIKLFDWPYVFTVQENFAGVVGVTSASSISGSGKKPVTAVGDSDYQNAYIGTNIISDVSNYVLVHENNQLFLAVGYTVSNDPAMENGTVIAMPSQAAAGQTVTLQTDSDDGYESVSIAVVDSKGNEIAVENDTFVMPARNVVVSATFKKLPYMIKFDANGGNLDIQESTTREDGTLATLPVPTHDDPKYSFKGWFTEAEGGTAVTAETVFTQNSAIYAQWTINSGNQGGSDDIPYIPVKPAASVVEPSAPKEVYAHESDSAELRITVINGAEPYSYQWQISRDHGDTWEPVGENHYIYITAAVTARNDGYLYRCIVHDAFGTELVSPIFTLRVIKTVDIPQTGDATNQTIRLGLAVLSFAVIFVCCGYLSRKNN